MSGNSKIPGLRSFSIVILILVFFVSCVGASSQIKINSDGSGTIRQVYRISHELQSMGKTDGNEGMFPLPVGKEDLERTVERISGLSLVSYTQRQDDKDIIIDAEFAFASPDALAALMEDGDQKFKIDLKNRKITMNFSAGEDSGAMFKDMIIAAFEGYDFSFSLTVPGQVKTAWFDENGKNVPQYPGTCSVRNNTVEYTVPMGVIVGLEDPLELEISW